MENGQIHLARRATGCKISDQRDGSIVMQPFLIRIEWPHDQLFLQIWHQNDEHFLHCWNATSRKNGTDMFLRGRSTVLCCNWQPHHGLFFCTVCARYYQKCYMNQRRTRLQTYCPVQNVALIIAHLRVSIIFKLLTREQSWQKLTHSIGSTSALSCNPESIISYTSHLLIQQHPNHWKRNDPETGPPPLFTSSFYRADSPSWKVWSSTKRHYFYYYLRPQSFVSSFGMPLVFCGLTRQLTTCNFIYAVSLSLQARRLV